MLAHVQSRVLIRNSLSFYTPLENPAFYVDFIIALCVPMPALKFLWSTVLLPSFLFLLHNLWSISIL